MSDTEPRYLVQQRKISGAQQETPVFARVMRSKEGVFEGVSFIRNREKASLLTLAEARQAVAWSSGNEMDAFRLCQRCCDESARTCQVNKGK